MIALLTSISAQLMVLLGIVGVLEDILFTGLAVLNGILAIIATLAIWKSYLVVGAKVALTALVVVPVVGIIVYFVWGRKKVDQSS